MHFRTIILALLTFAAIGSGQEFGKLSRPGYELSVENEESIPALIKSYAIENIVEPNAYILGPGDVIGINILTQTAQSFSLPITPTGDLFIPASGSCHVAGLNLTEAKKVVTNFILQQAYPKALVHITLLQVREFKLLVTGAVNSPGYVNVTPLTRLAEIVSESDGFHQLAQEFEIEIHRADGRIETANYFDFLLKGQVEANPTFLEGDRIHVPFGDVTQSGIVVRGSVEGTGYDIITEKEDISTYIRRQVVFGKDTDLQNVTITRIIDGNLTNIVVGTDSFENTSLAPGDVINFLWERGVMVTGFVQSPGGFSYFPGYSVDDYIALAGGNTMSGNPRGVIVSHQDGSIEKGGEVILNRGDVIFVPRARKDIYFGDLSVLGMITAIASIVLAYLATTQ